MVDHTIEAHFVVSSSTAQKAAAQAREDRIVEFMVQAMGGRDHGNFNAIRLENDARMIYRAVTVMHEALTKEMGQ